MQARQGDCRAFAVIFERFNGPICTYLARMVGNDEVGRDLAQDTFLKAWKSLPSLEGEQFFKAWLYRIATNVAHMHLRRGRLLRWLPWAEEAEDIRGTMPSVEGPEMRAGESEMIKHILSTLSPRYRTCLLLKVVAGFSQQEIAGLLGISAQGVGSNIFRAREQFRRAYQLYERSN